MRKVIYAMSVSLDGYIEDPNGGLDWSFPDEELHRFFNQREGGLACYLYGRRLYENMAAFWPTADQDPDAPQVEREYAQIWREKPKVVFSRSLQQVTWNARLVRDHLVEEVTRLKEQPGGDMSVSGAGIATSFLQLGLVDEVWQFRFPVLLGGGKPMFGPLDRPIEFSLDETRTFGSGVVLLKYSQITEF